MIVTLYHIPVDLRKRIEDAVRSVADPAVLFTVETTHQQLACKFGVDDTVESFNAVLIAGEGAEHVNPYLLNLEDVHVLIVVPTDQDDPKFRGMLRGNEIPAIYLATS